MQRYFSEIKNGDYFELKKDDIRHIKTVMRMNDNDNIEVVYNENVYLCCLENVKENIKIKIKKEQKKSKKITPEITLIIPLLKENKIDLILQKSTEMGVDKILLTPMERSIIRLEDKKTNKKIDRWNRICKEASEQSMRTTIPKIELLSSLKAVANLDGLNLICSTVERKNSIKKELLSLKKKNNYDKINLVIGPEGGISPNEEKFLVSSGYKRITLGNYIMRVETVPMFLMSIINYEFME